MSTSTIERPPCSRPGHRFAGSPFGALIVLLFTAAGCGEAAGPGGVPGDPRTVAITSTASGPAVLTQRYDNGRTGLNAYETALSPLTLPGNFGHRADATLDGALYAQPLFVPGGNPHGLSQDAVYVATEHNSVYALDAATLHVIWTVSVMTPTYGADPTATSVSSSYLQCTDISPEFGITGTPAIDLATGTLYVVSYTLEGHHKQTVYRLHALDLATGAPRYPSVTITASVNGTGSGTRRGRISLDPAKHLQRPGLLLSNGAVYVGFSGHCSGPFHGWVLGYAYDTTHGKWNQTAAWSSTPNGTSGGVWMSGTGITGDDAGHAFVAIGDASFDGVTEFGDSLVRLDLPTLTVGDYFAPYDQATLSSKDLDLGSGGVLMVPDVQNSRNVLVVGTKAGTVYLLDRSSLGGYSSVANGNLQTLAGAGGGGVYATPGYWNGNIYLQGQNDVLRAFSFTAGLLVQTSQSTSTSGFPGTSPVVSADGVNGGVVWTVQADGYASGAPAILHAYDATNVSHELYSSSWSSGDTAGPAVKFGVPLVAKGSVYVGAVNRVTRYGF